jgi:hypothetical protein
MEDIKQYIKELKKRMEEQTPPGNTTSNVSGYNIPGAFAASKSKHKKRMDIIARALGYNPVKDKKQKYFVNIHKKPLKTESLYTNMASNLFLNEIKYKDFKNDKSMSDKQKMNIGIKKINRILYELESIVSQHAKFKHEGNITNDQYWMQSKRKLNKIVERLVKISKKIIEISS